MANQQKYFIGPSLLSDIRSTIQRVDAIAPRTSGAAQEVRLQMLQQPMDGGGRLRIGKYTGSSTWGKHTTATIDLWESGTPPNETSSSQTIENVVNHWADVPANKWVGVQRAANGTYYLVVAEC